MPPPAPTHLRVGTEAIPTDHANVGPFTFRWIWPTFSPSFQLGRPPLWRNRHRLDWCAPGCARSLARAYGCGGICVGTILACGSSARVLHNSSRHGTCLLGEWSSSCFLWHGLIIA
jgi:hypothetical protein